MALCTWFLVAVEAHPVGHTLFASFGLCDRVRLAVGIVPHILDRWAYHNMTKGRQVFTPSVWCSPCSMLRLEILSYAPIPSMDKILLVGLA